MPSKKTSKPDSVENSRPNFVRQLIEEGQERLEDLVGAVASIEMVVFCAVGGRLSIVGAAFGAFAVSWAKTSLSDSFPQIWPVVMGALFIGVVMFFPRGLAGLVSDYGSKLMPGRKSRSKPSTHKPDTASRSAAGTTPQEPA